MNSTDSALINAKQLRSFGLTVGGIFMVLCLWPLIRRGNAPRVEGLLLAVTLILLAVFLPRSLSSIHRAWMTLGTILGWINTRIVLGLGFYGLFTPLGLGMRLWGNDPLRRAFDPHIASYRVARTPRPGIHMQKQF